MPGYVLDHHASAARAARLALMSTPARPDAPPCTSRRSASAGGRKKMEEGREGEPGARTLEVGFGNGSVSSWLAELVGPTRGGRDSYRGRYAGTAGRPTSHLSLATRTPPRRTSTTSRPTRGRPGDPAAPAPGNEWHTSPGYYRSLGGARDLRHRDRARRPRHHGRSPTPGRSRCGDPRHQPRSLTGPGRTTSQARRNLVASPPGAGSCSSSRTSCPSASPSPPRCTASGKAG